MKTKIKPIFIVIVRKRKLKMAYQFTNKNNADYFVKEVRRCGYKSIIGTDRGDSK